MPNGKIFDGFSLIQKHFYDWFFKTHNFSLGFYLSCTQLTVINIIQLCEASVSAVFSSFVSPSHQTLCISNSILWLYIA